MYIKCLIFINKGPNQYGDTLLHSAILDEDLKRVQALINLGAKTSHTRTIWVDENALSNVSGLHIAVYEQNPEMLASLLLSSDSIISINIKCKDAKRNFWTPLDLALSIFDETKNEQAKMVGTYLFFNYRCHNALICKNS